MGKVARNAGVANSLTEALLVQRELEAIVAELNYYHSVIDARSALVNLYISCGVDLVSPAVNLDDLGSLPRAVSDTAAPWINGRLPDVPIPQPAAPAPATKPI
jgi:hypothetical protein